MAARRRPAAAPRAQPAALAGVSLGVASLSAVSRPGRITSDTGYAPQWGPIIVPPRLPELDWQTLQLDADSLTRVSPARALELLTDLSPDVSRATWDWLRLSNPGFEVVARRPGSDQPDKAGQAWAESFLHDTLADLYGSVDVPISRLFMAVFLRGAVFCEGVLDAAGRELIDLATPDPQSVRFILVRDPIRGEVWQLAQQQAQRLVLLDRPTVRYAPLDPFPGSPYGRSMVSPALFPTLFGLGLLHDLRRVVAQQGYPRIDIAVMIDKLRDTFPAAAADPDEWEKWVQGYVNDVADAYDHVGPGDAYVHSDAVELRRPVGTLDSSSLGAVDGLTSMLDRLALRALKTMPLMFGITDGASEANANRQWEVQTAGIKAAQHLVENVLSRILSLGAQARGLPVVVELRFAELRASEMFRDAQTLALRVDNWYRMVYELQVATVEEAAEDLVGHPPPPPEELPQPPTPAGGVPPAAAPDGNPEPGADRSVEFDEDPAHAPSFEAAVRSAAEAHGVDPDAVLAILHREIPPPTPLPVEEPAAARTNGSSHGSANGTH